MWKWHNIHTGEHTGTHVDAPAHWVTGKDGWTVDQIPPERLIGPAVVVDVTAEVAADPDFLLEPSHLLAWEDDNGGIPDNAWVLLRTGWSARGRDQETFLNADENGPHTPGPSAEAARWLAEERADHRLRGGDRRHRRRRRRRHGSGLPGALLPARGRQAGSDAAAAARSAADRRAPCLFVQPLRLVGGTGSPARVLALVERPDAPGSGAGAELVGRAVADLGAAHAFGVVGSGNFAVTNALVAAGVPFVAARHEGGAATMADAYARTSGRSAC